MVHNDYFIAEKRSDSMWQITGLVGEKCYLIEGDEQALLIDGLMGIGSLRAFVRKLTNLPVLMAVTHGHIDHIGAAFEYQEVMIHPADISLLYSEAHGSEFVRRKSVSMLKQYGKNLPKALCEEDAVSAHPVNTTPIHDGNKIDLGGRVLEVIEVPGHSGGSVVFLDREARLCYGGDVCNLNTLLNLDGSETVETYYKSLLHFRQYQDSFDLMYTGHDPNGVKSSILDDGIHLCERILAETDDAVPMEDGAFLAAARNTDFTPKYGGLCNIVYRKERVRN